jgi:hypothetical protein
MSAFRAMNPRDAGGAGDGGAGATCPTVAGMVTIRCVPYCA